MENLNNWQEVLNVKLAMDTEKQIFPSPNSAKQNQLPFELVTFLLLWYTMTKGTYRRKGLFLAYSPRGIRVQKQLKAHVSNHKQEIQNQLKMEGSFKSQSSHLSDSLPPAAPHLPRLHKQPNSITNWVSNIRMPKKMRFI